MPYLRFTRDRRGYEHTYLMHVAGPGDKARVLYWYRTAPGVRIGRPALDEDAIRLIEEQHPNVEFDWAHILEIGSMSSPEVEVKVEPRKRKARREDEPREGRDTRDSREPRRGAPMHAPSALATPLGLRVPPANDLDANGDDVDATVFSAADEAAAAVPRESSPVRRSGFDEDDALDAQALPKAGLLEELVGVGIATRLRARHAELLARLHQAPGDAMAHEEWAARLEAINPDAWVTPAEVLHGVQQADRLFDQLRREIVGG